jgi:hypothetical protein
MLPVWGSSQVNAVQGLQEDRVPKLWKDRHMQVVCWKKYEKPTGAKFGGKGKPGGGEKGVAFIAHKETRDGAWILDLGCTQHLTGDKGKFKTLEAVGSRKKIEFGNKQSLAAEGVGEVELCDTGWEASGDLAGGVVHSGSCGESIFGEKGHGEGS